MSFIWNLLRYPSSFKEFSVDETLGFSGRKARSDEFMGTWIRRVAALLGREEFETVKVFVLVSLGGAYDVARNSCLRGIPY